DPGEQATSVRTRILEGREDEKPLALEVRGQKLRLATSVADADDSVAQGAALLGDDARLPASLLPVSHDVGPQASRLTPASALQDASTSPDNCGSHHTDGRDAIFQDWKEGDSFAPKPSLASAPAAASPLAGDEGGESASLETPASNTRAAVLAAVLTTGACFALWRNENDRTSSRRGKD